MPGVARLRHSLGPEWVGDASLGVNSALPILLTALVSTVYAPAAVLADPWLDAVVAFAPGESAGFGAEALPRVIRRAPRGGGLLQGSTDVVSLGDGGSISLAFRDNLVFDGPGDDLVIFENAFHVGSEGGPIFTELAFVEVSDDNRVWHRFPFDALSGEGLAGASAVLASRENGIDPLGPNAGGDRFDIAAVGLSFVRFVRIVDGGGELDDVGNRTPSGNKGGFDLDAAGAIHSTAPALVYGVVAVSGSAVARARVKLVPTNGGRNKRRRSRSDGSFRFHGVIPSGDYTLVARRAGIGRASTSIYVDMQQDRVEAQLLLE